MLVTGHTDGQTLVPFSNSLLLLQVAGRPLLALASPRRTEYGLKYNSNGIFAFDDMLTM